MVEQRIAELAEHQHGCIGLDQLRALGVSPAQRRHLTASGRIVAVSASAFRLAGAPTTLQSRRMAAVLDAGADAVLSHDASAAAWGFGRDGRPRLQVARTRRITPRASHLAQVHVVRDLRPWHVVLRDRVPMTTPARTIVDLAATAHPERVARLLDAAWSRRLLNVGEVDCIVKEVRRKGRSGVILLDELLAERRHRPRPGSALEMRFLQVLRRYGLPDMRQQVQLSDDQGWIGCVDFVGVDVPIVVFVDGAAWHTSLTDVRHDDLQTQRIRALGYHVERVTDLMVLFEEDALVRRLRPLLVRDRVA